MERWRFLVSWVQGGEEGVGLGLLSCLCLLEIGARRWLTAGVGWVSLLWFGACCSCFFELAARWWLVVVVLKYEVLLQ
jgi:hypothetical protein